MRVTANDVLLRTAARMDRLAETLPSKPSGARLAGSMSQMCFPKPSGTEAVVRQLATS